MITRIFDYGRSFKGVIRYNTLKKGSEPLNFREDHMNSVIGGMVAVARMNQRVQKPVLHLTMSLPKDHTLSRETWSTMIHELVDALGYQEHQKAIWLHHDTDHEHAHVVINRVNPYTFKPAPNRNEKLRSRLITNRLMAKYNLPPLPLAKSPERLTQAEVQLHRRIRAQKQEILEEHGGIGYQELPLYAKTEWHDLDLQCIKQSIKVRVIFAASHAKTIAQLIKRLNTLGVLVRIKGGKIHYGLSQKRDHPPMWMAGQKIGRHYSLSGLEQLGIVNDQGTRQAQSAQPPTLHPPLPPPGLLVCILQQDRRPTPWQPRSRFLTKNSLFRSLYRAGSMISTLNAAIQSDKRKNKQENPDEEEQITEVRRGFGR